MKETRLITAALPYINNVPHLGHIVGSHLPADIFARFCRLRGYKTIFVGGTDEHGSTSEIAAAQAGVDVAKFGTALHAIHKRIYEWFKISYDNFSRTPNGIHYETTQAFFKKVFENGYIAKKTIKVFYSPKDQRFLPDRYITGTCPKCGYERATGDQCEKCTSVLEPTQLISPRSVISGDVLELRETEHLFLCLDRLSPKLEDWIKASSGWRSQVTGIALGWIRDGLRERCITRDLKHGVPVPLEGMEGKVFYVWFDAPIGYISFTRELLPESWEDIWRGKNSRVFHFLGKDNIPFHTIFWPGMLIANGTYNLPSQIIGLQYLNYEGTKFSKSQKNGVFCEKLPEAGIIPDILRGALTPMIPETGDTEFKWEEFQRRVNSDLIGNFGNLINRTINFIYKRLDGEVSRPADEAMREPDKILLAGIRERAARITELMEAVKIREAFAEMLALANDGNKFFDDTKPWTEIKTDKVRASHILFLCASLCRTLAILSKPYLPDTSDRILYQLNLQPVKDGDWDSAAEMLAGPSHKVNPPEVLFARLDEAALQAFKDKVTTPADLSAIFSAR